MKRTFLQYLAAATLACVLAPALSFAQTGSWPARPVRVVVPFPAGGATDIVSRALTDKLTLEFAQQFIVDNRPGAATLIAAEAVARSPADGYTFFMATTASLVTNRFLYKKLSYDPEAFEPVSLVCVQPLVLLAHPSVPANNVPDLMKYVKANAGKISYASFGTGTQSHLGMELLNIRSGTTMAHVPYKGATEALPALIGGHVQLYIDSIASSLPHIKSGAVKALAVTSLQRSAVLPNVPTVAEQGYPDFEMAPWCGLAAMKGTPAEATEKLRVAIDKIMRSAEFKDKLLSLGQEAPFGGAGPAAFAAQIKAELPRTAKLLKDVGIEPQ